MLQAISAVSFDKSRYRQSFKFGAVALSEVEKALGKPKQFIWKPINNADPEVKVRLAEDGLTPDTFAENYRKREAEEHRVPGYVRAKRLLVYTARFLDAVSGKPTSGLLFVQDGQVLNLTAV